MDGWMGGQRDERKISIMSEKKQNNNYPEMFLFGDNSLFNFPPPQKKDVRQFGREHLRHRDSEFIDVL